MNDHDRRNPHAPPAMSAAAAQQALADAQALAEDGTHYLRSVTDMAEHCPVVTQDAIYTDSGIKLVEKGVRIDSRLYDRLVQHKLRDPIDGLLGTEHTVDLPAIEAAALAQCADEQAGGGLGALLARAHGGPEALIAPLRGMVLPAPMAFKLTVMREQRRELFDHSVRMMLLAVHLALGSGRGARDASLLAAAALLHDIGVMHMDPVWNDPEHKVTGPDRKHLVAHPITAALLLRAQGAFPPAVETAVLEHHERMDGTGYPRGLRGPDISPMGQILMLAEVATAFFEKYSALAAQRLSLSLRLNHRKFAPHLAALLQPLLADGPGAAVALSPPQEEAGRMLATLGGAFDRWAELRAGVPAGLLAGDSRHPGAFVEQRLQALQQSLVEAGAHPRQESEIAVHLQGDPQGASELALVRGEALWQLGSIVHATQRRWPRLSGNAPIDAAEAVVAAWCAHCAGLLAAA
ncbi:HD domain-containing protein [Acidovorax sp. GBBC 3334]|uniref:HD-GYP domain-containing protein n=1 Tax=Acidovorax sp. GBBC 3334 TaxID=2940496 RepID=UPI0023035239|nr:HD domain-containing phosphohydrolase [Acidovorax sp. GBBC 3334]MDA8456119.1 HD domain-containing protein [Acidovorax sp. GBBC 3334]